MSLNLDYIKTALNGIRQYVQSVQKKLEKDTNKKIKDNTPDWNQNDPEGKGYIQNRPFYEDPILLGNMTYTATSETEMTHTATDDDMDLMKGIYELVDEGTVLKAVINGLPFLLDVEFDRGNFFFNGEIEGYGYYRSGREWGFNVRDFLTLTTGNTYVVKFWSLAKGVTQIPLEYISDRIFRKGFSPVNFGSGIDAMTQGRDTAATGSCSHAEGQRTTASGAYSHAEGYYSKATGYYSHAEGQYTIANHSGQHAQGAYNVQDPSTVSIYSRGNFAHIVGNGESDSKRSNAHTLDWSGNAWFAGDVYVGSTSGTNKDDGSKKLATEEYVDGKCSESGKNVSLGLTGVSVGQVLVVKTVDDNGKPLTWEAKNISDLVSNGNEVNY